VYETRKSALALIGISLYATCIFFRKTVNVVWHIYYCSVCSIW